MISAIGFYVAKLFYDELKAERLKKFFGWLSVIVVILIVLAVSGFFIKSCYINKKIDETRTDVQEKKADVDKAKIELEVVKELSEQGKVSQKVVEEKTKKVEKSEKEFTEAVEKDSGEYASDYPTARQLYCESHPADCK